MQLKHMKLAVAVATVGLISSAKADFVNGGFETGTFAGWTLRTGQYTGGGIGAINWNGLAGTNTIVTTGHVDPYSPFDNPFNGNYMAQLGDLYGTSTNPSGTGRNASELSQTYTLTGLETGVYINWGTVLVEPTNAHDTSTQPLFNIRVVRNNNTPATLLNVSHTADGGGFDGGGGNVAALNGTPWYDSGQDFIGGLSAGDSITVILTVTDCGLGGHGGMAYLDGISTEQSAPPPGAGVPDGGTTALLLVPALFGIAGFRRKS